jgi:hypothetical protein
MINNISSIAQSVCGCYGLEEWTLIPGRGRDFCHHAQTSSGAHPASCPVDTRDSLECEANHASQSVAMVKNVWSHTSTFPYDFLMHSQLTNICMTKLNVILLYSSKKQVLCYITQIRHYILMKAPRLYPGFS